MDGVSVQSHVVNVEAAASHVLFAEDALLTSPLKTGHHRVLDFIQVLNSLRRVDNKVWTSDIRAKAPNSTRMVELPAVLFSNILSSGLFFLLMANFSVFR